MKFKIIIDQNISIEIAQWLTIIKPEWEVYHTSQVGLSAESDRKIFDWAQAQQAIIITFDEDFADQRTFPVGRHCGIIRLKVWPTTIEETKSALNRLFSEFKEKDIDKALVIIDRKKIRVRKITTT